MIKTKKLNKHRKINIKKRKSTVGLKHIRKTKTRKQHGGNDNPIIYTIPNSGIPKDGEKGMSNQCLWISISDYFKYHKNDNTKTVKELKRLGGIPLNNIRYNNNEYDDTIPKLKNNIINICNTLKLSLHFIYIYNGQIANYCLSTDKKTIKPFRIINPKGQDKICIATYGRHFELIVRIGEEPNPLYRLIKQNHDASLNPTQYHPKIPIKQDDNTFEYKNTTEDNTNDIKNAKILSLIESLSLFQYNIEENKKSLQSLCGNPHKNQKEIGDLNNLLKINQNLLTQINKDIENSPDIKFMIDIMLALKLQKEESNAAIARLST